MGQDADSAGRPGEAAPPEASSEAVEVKLTISRAAYERAKQLAAEKDPNRSTLGEFAGMMDVEEFLGHFLEAHLER